MKIPQLRKSDAKRERQFEAAIVTAKQIAAEEGVAGLTARRIAKGAGCSVGTLYNLFGNLDTVILYLNAGTLEDLANALSGLDDPGDPVARVEALVHRYMTFVEDNANLWNVIFEHQWPKDYVLPDWYRQRIDGLLGQLAEALVPLCEGAPAEQVVGAATVLWSGLYGISSLAVSGKLGNVSSEDALSMATMLTRTFLQGLRSS